MRLTMDGLAHQTQRRRGAAISHVLYNGLQSHCEFTVE